MEDDFWWERIELRHSCWWQYGKMKGNFNETGRVLRSEMEKIQPIMLHSNICEE
jgi:hypothetical protein